MSKLPLFLLALLFAILSTDSVRCDPPIPIDRFAMHSEGEFQSWIDRRDLLVMHHPWLPSATGGYCEATATLSLPSDFKPPLRLSLYQSDDYFNDFWRAKNDSWLGGDGFYGHRFKQIWVDDHLLWESDVADADPPMVSGILMLDLPNEVAESEEITLTLKVVDKVSSWIELASDTQHISSTEVAAEKPEDPAKYWTNVYWGDVQVLSGTEERSPGLPPVQQRLRKRETRSEGTKKGDQGQIQPPFQFRLSCATSLPTVGYPVRCGVPLPSGIHLSPEMLSLADSNDGIIPAHVEKFVQHSEGWTKWAAVEFLARPGMEEGNLTFSEHPQSPDQVEVFRILETTPEGVTLFEGHQSGLKICRAGTDLYFASCEVRFDPEHTQELMKLPLLNLKGETARIRLGYSDRVDLATNEIEGLTVDSPGWMVIDQGDGHHFISLRWIEGIEGTRLRIDRSDSGTQIALLPYVVDGQPRPYPATQGEAKTFELLYCRFDGAAPEDDYPLLAGNFNHPPLLINPEHLGKSNVWGGALPPSESVGEALTKFLEDSPPASFSWGTTLRDFGDIIYSGTNSWRNGYYDLRQGFVAAYLISGNREWADALDRTVRHTVDVDMIHWSEQHPYYVGLPHGYGENHTSMDPWNALMRTNGIFAAAHLWANTEYYKDALQISEKIAVTGRGVGAVSVRDHAGIMMTLAVALRETGDPIFREAGKKVIEDIAKNRVDSRRGCYPEVHGNWNYRGNVPWMVAQLIEPLYIYYRETGDLEAASLMVGMADSFLAENQTRGVPGDIHGYSHNPHYAKHSGYHVLIAPCLFYAYELTGDDTFREAAVAAWEQTVREETINSVLNCFWNTPALVYYLREWDRG